LQGLKPALETGGRFAARLKHALLQSDSMTFAFHEAPEQS